MFKDTNKGQTHYENDCCGEPAHNPMPNSKQNWKLLKKIKGREEGYCDKCFYERKERVYMLPCPIHSSNYQLSWSEEFDKRFPYRTRDTQEHQEKERIKSFLHQQIEKAEQEGYAKGRLKCLEQGGCIGEVKKVLSELEGKIKFHEITEEEKISGDGNYWGGYNQAIAEIINFINSYKLK